MQTTTWHRVPPISRFATLIRWLVTPLGTHLLQLAILTPIALWLGWQLKAPDPLPASAPATAFSAERAMTYVEQIAQQPHPLGSEDNRRVRRYLVDELTALGLAPEIQTATTTRNMWGEDLTGTVHNIVARLNGTNATRATYLGLPSTPAPERVLRNSWAHTGQISRAG